MKISCILTYFVLAILFFFGIETALAQERERRIEEETRGALALTETRASQKKGRLAVDYGGWLNLRYIDYNEDDNDSSSLDTYDSTSWMDTRLWMKATLKPALNAPYENEHFFYIRMKDLVVERRPDDTAGGGDHDGPHLEYAYLAWDAQPFWLKLGRQYFSVGEGIALSNVNDGAMLVFLSRKFNLRTFVSHTLPHEDNIDLSVPGYDKDSDRYFYGLECSYLGIPQQNFYGYVVIQRDFSNEHPQDPAHDYRYDSEYFGLGNEGKIQSELSYRMELIKETGKSFIYETDEKKNVDAWAGVFKLAYEPQVYSHPNLSFTYAFGSGDTDRVSVTDTQFGNTSGKDRNFLYFGYIPTGYALFPNLSNLYFYQIGLSFKPLEKVSLCRHLALGVDYFRYYKDEKEGGIYDPEANQANDDIGQEVDVTVTWQILSDLGFSVQYGYFRPGKAYPDATNDSETYLSLSTTILF